jgi:uncharacterized membrane protein YhaH (DUF805 family)
LNWAKLFLSLSGRIGRATYWLAFFILLIPTGFALLFPYGWIFAVAGSYPWMCVSAKRLHDMGERASLEWIPVAISLMTVAVAGLMAGFDVPLSIAGISQEALLAKRWQLEVLQWTTGLNMLAWGIFINWIGASPSWPRENRHGPVPPLFAVTDPGDLEAWFAENAETVQKRV